MSEMITKSTEANPTKLAPWVEKYRPARVEDVAHQDEVVGTLKKSIEIGNLPHLLFHGAPGTGKTTTVLAVAKALYGPDLYKSRLLELNASDERGISVVRHKIKTFAQGAVGTQKTPGYPCPRFKIIVLDEVDTMTPDAQSALRRIIEAYSKVTRFCLICNYVTRVIEPLASRCAKFRFKPLPVEAMRARMEEIAVKEQVKLAAGTMDAILKASKGDMRKAVTYLQSSYQLSIGDSIVTPDIVFDLSGQVPPSAMEKLWVAVLGGTFDALQSAVKDAIYEGYPLSSILLQLHEDVVANTELKDVDKALICEKIAEADQYLADGASELLQLMDITAFAMRKCTQSSAAVDSHTSSNH